ncbi:MAG TPA: ABC transporter substrate-binding protein [Solirubrobacterales bacterium]|nr:ABC transporter substrate-binding protein [Solirubrobacterales bacterium]
MRASPLALLMAVVAATVSLAGGVGACGGGEDASPGSPDNPQPFTLDLDWYVNPDHAGIFTAIDKGFFRQVGLDVKPQVPSDPSAPIKEVAAGRADLAISYEPEVMLAADRGLDVEAVGAVVDSPLTSLISLPRSGITSAADLSGKTVGTAGIPYQSDYLETILQTGGLSASSTEEVNVGLNLLPALIGGRVDAILGGFRNIEGVDLQQRGLDPRIVPVDQLGVPTYDELVLVARRSTVEEHPEAIRAFIEALGRGTDYARAHPQEAASAVLSAGMGLDPMQTRAEIGATLPLLAPPQGRPYGYLDPAAWRAYAQWMADHDLISSAAAPSDVLTNELLP